VGALEEGSMERTAVNPWKWSLDIGFNQAEVIAGHRREAICSGQTSVDADGHPQHPGDMRAQVGLAMVPELMVELEATAAA
jgi:hypothetical protein